MNTGKRTYKFASSYKRTYEFRRTYERTCKFGDHICSCDGREGRNKEKFGRIPALHFTGQVRMETTYQKFLVPPPREGENATKVRRLISLCNLVDMISLLAVNKLFLRLFPLLYFWILFSLFNTTYILAEIKSTKIYIYIFLDNRFFIINLW